MKVTVKTTGFKEMEEALFLLKNSTAKSLVRRHMKKALEPVKQMAEDKAPRNPREHKHDRLSENILIGTRATKVVKKSDLEVYCGPSKSIAHAIPQEFGTVKHAPSPYMRPAWDTKKMQVLASYKEDLWQGIKKSIARQERKIAREAAKIKRGR